MGMSYRWALHTLNRFEQTVGVKLVERKIGGAAGGGCRLTVPGRKFLAEYEQFRAEAERAIAELLQRHFATWPRLRSARL